MFYLGIDIGKFHHAAALMDERGEVFATLPSFPNTRSGFQKLLSLITSHLPQAAELRIGMEATGPYWIPLAEWLKTRGWPPVILNPIKTASLRNYGIRGSKTDSIDSVLIANTLRIEGEQPQQSSPKQSEELRDFTRVRADMVKDRTRIVLRVASLLDRLFPELLSSFSKTLSPSCLALLCEAPTPSKVLALGEKKLTALLHKASGGKLGVTRAKEIIDKAVNSIGVTSQALAEVLALLLEQINLLDSQLRTLNQHITELYEETGLYFTSIAGVGTLSAATILGEFGTIRRFSQATQMVAFAGIDPKLRSSGKHQGQVHISKRGSRYLRRALYLACQGAVRNDEYFHSIYQRHRDNGKSYK
ncbi:MAG: IS110 family transposase, partial [Candidatus Bipolaricaulota bacterium]|nr:IS110 family transposase [Candidatus Bipolaricaulota bacterium]